MDSVLVDVRIAGMRSGAAWDIGTRAGAIAVRDGTIAWIGAVRDAPRASRTLHGDGRWVTPGLIDCHTHLVHAGQRAHEFALRLGGATYEEIARAGGGIVSTVAATRAASEQELVATALPRLQALASEGVTVVEIKSGYGLDLDTELRMLRAARALGALVPVTVRTTLLALHALPREFAERSDDYVDYVCREVIPAAADAGLADAVDAFCERIAFTKAQVDRVFHAARAHGLPVKLHAEQLTNMEGAALVAQHGGLSADHLEHADEAGIQAMAAAGTVAVLLPGAFFFLRETTGPPVDLLRRHGVPIAIASDNNPGTSPYASLLLMLNMACTLFRLTPQEALAGITRNAARALGMQDSHGTIEVGKRADLVLWDVADPVELAYSYGTHRPSGIVRGGELLPGGALQ